MPLLWVPGWHFLGGTYSASVVQAFYVFTACGQHGSGGNCNGAGSDRVGGFVYTNTFWQPIDLSWNLGGGWFMSAGLLLHGAERYAHDRHAEPRLLDLRAVDGVLLSRQ